MDALSIRMVSILWRQGLAVCISCGGCGKPEPVNCSTNQVSATKANASPMREIINHTPIIFANAYAWRLASFAARLSATRPAPATPPRLRHPLTPPEPGQIGYRAGCLPVRQAPLRPGLSCGKPRCSEPGSVLAPGAYLALVACWQADQ